VESTKHLHQEESLMVLALKEHSFITHQELKN